MSPPIKVKVLTDLPSTADDFLETVAASYEESELDAMNLSMTSLVEQTIARALRGNFILLYIFNLPDEETKPLNFVSLRQTGRFYHKRYSHQICFATQFASA